MRFIVLSLALLLVSCASGLEPSPRPGNDFWYWCNVKGHC